MNSIKSIILVAISCSILVACGTSSKAPIENRARQNSTSSKTSIDARTQYVVKKGDTLYRIAVKKGQSYNDLLSWNNLANPHDIKVGQILRVVPPETGTSSIAGPSDIDVRPLESGVTRSSSSGNNKNGPRADKRPYSEAALAELKRSEPINTGPAKSEKTPADDIVWVWPVEGKVPTKFDHNKSKGVDFLGKAGQNIYAAAAGTVMYAGSGIRGYGNLVIVKHSNNFLSAYAHNQAILVKEKQVISKGQKIAEMGNSDSDIVKLHFEIRQQGKPVDPMKFLPSR